MRRRFKDKPAADDAGRETLPQSILTLTGLTNGGFTIGMALASQENEEGDTTVHKVDVILMALVNMIRSNDPAFIAEVNRVNSAILKLTTDLGADDMSPEDAVEAFKSEMTMAEGLAPEADND